MQECRAKAENLYVRKIPGSEKLKGMPSFLKTYFEKVPERDRSPAATAYAAALDAVAAHSPSIAEAVYKELKSQRENLKLIASENYSSLPVQLAMGNLLTDKYGEGYPGHRFYAGCEQVDAVEEEAASLAKELFQAEHAYVQPHSGADANLVAFWAILVDRVQSKEVERLGKKNVMEMTSSEYEEVRRLLVSQKVLGMSLGAGGHLTHGYRHNISAKMMQASSYELDPSTYLLDYKAIEAQALEEKPLILLAGYSSYPRRINFAKMREIADRAGAVLMVDMAHFAGLVAGGVLQGEENPIPYADIVTSTTHKTLRGPRGGLILCKGALKEAVNKGCPLVLGGPLPHVMAAKAVAFREALSPSFRAYAQSIVSNARALSSRLAKNGVHLLTGGTDNHLLVVDVYKSFGLTGLQAEGLLRKAHLTVNRNAILHDANGPWVTSGVRMGTPAVTTLGMGAREMEEIADLFTMLLQSAKPLSRSEAAAPDEALQAVQEGVKALLARFPLYPELTF